VSVVNAACAVDGNVGHLLVVFLGIRPQVEVNDGGVDVAGLPVPLLHQLVELLLDQLHRPDGTSSDLHLPPGPGAQQLTCTGVEGEGKVSDRELILIRRTQFT